MRHLNILPLPYWPFYPKALTWYRKAADLGDLVSQFKLGSMYSQGKGVPRDYVQAHKWFNLAASHAPDEIQDRYERARDAVAEKMTSAQIAEAQKLAREWKPK